MYTYCKVSPFNDLIFWWFWVYFLAQVSAILQMLQKYMLELDPDIIVVLSIIRTTTCLLCLESWTATRKGVVAVRFRD